MTEDEVERCANCSGMMKMWEDHLAGPEVKEKRIEP